MTIRFGTSGWRAAIADEIHFCRSTFGLKRNLLPFRKCQNSRKSHGGARGLPVNETPVGFKYIGELINENKIVIGGEESAGLSIKGHYPEKDGILACLLAAEAVAARGTSLTEQLKDLYGRVGKLESGRIGIRLTPELMQSLGDKLKEDPKEIGGRRVERTNRIDGAKVYFCGRFMAVDAAFRDRTGSTHLRGIRIRNGLGGAS